MNERIKELAEQAGFETNGVICSFGNYKVDNEYFFAEDFIEDELAKFAELIVMDCMSICEELGDKGLDGHYCADEIVKHFGVRV